MKGCPDPVLCMVGGAGEAKEPYDCCASAVGYALDVGAIAEVGTGYEDAGESFEAAMLGAGDCWPLVPCAGRSMADVERVAEQKDTTRPVGRPAHGCWPLVGKVACATRRDMK